MDIIQKLFIAFGLLVLSPAIVTAEDQPEGLPPAIAALVQATGALTKSSSAIVDNRPTAVRTYKLRQQISISILEKKDQAPSIPANSNLLCEPRRKQLPLLSSITYLNTVTAQVKKTAKSEITSDTDLNNIIRAFKSLFTDYRLEIDGVHKGEEATGIESKITSDCEADLNSYALSYYSLNPQEETAVLAAFTALYELFKSIVAPIIVEGARFVDEEKRLNRIRKFLANEDNQALIMSNVKNLRDFIERYEKARTAEAVGHFVEARAALVSNLKPAKEVKECKVFVESGATKLPEKSVPPDSFVDCFNAVWSANKERIANRLIYP
jgi:hypothetical protein